MPLLLQLVWLGTGLLLGALLGLWLGRRGPSPADQARLTAAEVQQRRLLDKLREQNQELMAQIEASGARQARATEALRQSHAADKTALEAQLAEQQDKLRRMALAFSDGHVISGTSFEATRFDEPAA